MGQSEQTKSTITKKAVLVRKKTVESIKIDQALSELGNRLKQWDGKDLEVISKPMSNVLKSSGASYEETKNANFLLCAMLVNLSVSYVLTRGIMGSVLGFKTEFPKASFNNLGEQVITLSQVVNQQNELNSKLLSFLQFIYTNKLMPSMARPS